MLLVLVTFSFLSRHVWTSWVVFVAVLLVAAGIYVVAAALVKLGFFDKKTYHSKETWYIPYHPCMVYYIYLHLVGFCGKCR